MPFFETVAVVGALLGEGVAVAPWQGGLHPGLRAGVETRSNRQDAAVAVVQRAHLTGWTHDQVGTATAALVELGLRPTVGPVGLDGSVGGGALLSHAQQPRFSDERPYQPASPWDLDAAFLVGLGLDLQASSRLGLFARAELLGELPFGLLGNPVLPHRTVQVGLRVALGGGR